MFSRGALSLFASASGVRAFEAVRQGLYKRCRFIATGSNTICAPVATAGEYFPGGIGSQTSHPNQLFDSIIADTAVKTDPLSTADVALDMKCYR